MKYIKVNHLRQIRQSESRFLWIRKKTWDSILLINLATLSLLIPLELKRNNDLQNSFPTQVYAQVKPTATPTPTPTDKDIIFSQKHGDIIYRIWGLETSFSKQPFLFCSRKGLRNDFGFNVLNKQCFNSFSDEVQAVEGWIEQHEGLSLGKMLCIYNKGLSQKDCNYAENFLNL